MAKIVDIPEDLPGDIKGLLQNINDYVDFDQGDEEVGEELSPDIEKWPLIVYINPQITRTLEELAEIADHRVIPSLLSMFECDSRAESGYVVYWFKFTHIGSNIYSGNSSPLTWKVGGLLADAVGRIITRSGITCKELCGLYPELGDYKFKVER